MRAPPSWRRNASSSSAACAPGSLIVGPIPDSLTATARNGETVTLNRQQLTHAATIITTGSQTDGVGRPGVVIALMAALTESHLRMIFLRDLGLTPKDWMRWERMVVARRMLLWGHELLAISKALGFTHINSFKREFRLVYGVAPRVFLKIRQPEF